MPFSMNMPAPINHPFLGAGQSMPPPPGVMQPGPVQANPGMMPGMGPHPTGQFPLNPGTVPTGQFPLNPVAGTPLPSALPPTGAFSPDAFFQGLPPNVQAQVQNYASGGVPTSGGNNGFDRQGWHQAIQAWRGQRPDVHGGPAGSTAFGDWRDSRPQRSAY